MPSPPPKRLPLQGYGVGLLQPAVADLPTRAVRVEGQDWGALRPADVWRRLAARAGGPAVVELFAEFTAGGPLSGVGVRVAGAPPREVRVDGRDAAPRSGTEGPFLVRETLAPGRHEVAWSFVGPPEAPGGGSGDEGDEPGAARLVGRFRVAGGALHPLPETVDLRELDAALHGVVLRRRVSVPPGYQALQLEGPGPHSYEVALDDVPLIPRGDLPGHFLLLPPGADEAELAITFPGAAAPVRLLQLLP